MRLTTLGGRLARFWMGRNRGSIDIYFILQLFDQSRIGLSAANFLVLVKYGMGSRKYMANNRWKRARKGLLQKERWDSCRES